MSVKKFLKSKLQDNSQKHSEWIKDEMRFIHCNLCGQMPFSGIVSTPYCPWCGAMMKPDIEPNSEKIEWKISPSGCFKECSGCHQINSPETPFCPHCGAKTNYWDTLEDND